MESLKLTTFLRITFGQDQIMIVGVKLHGINVVRKRKMGGLSLVDLIETIEALFSKWVVHVLEFGSINL